MITGNNNNLEPASLKISRFGVQFNPAQLRARFYQQSHPDTQDLGHPHADRGQVFEAWERESDVVNAAGAGVGADEVEDPVAPCEVEVAAAEEVDPGFFEPEFADQEVGDVVCEGRGLEF